MMVCLQVNVLQSYVHCIILKNWDLIWGLFINVSKCEVFSPQGNHLFPPAVKSSNLEIRGVPIGDYLYCSHFIVEKCFKAKVLLSALVEVAAADLHVGASLLRICSSYL